jgi:hypothetical protein
MRRLSDSHTFSGTVIRNGKKMKVREPEINDEKKTILHVAFFSYSSFVCAFPGVYVPGHSTPRYLEVK